MTISAMEAQLSGSRARARYSDHKKSAVIIVTYNSIPRMDQLENALARNNIDFIIFVDNNSNNTVLERLKGFSEKHRDRAILQMNGQNLGLSKALNIGIEVASKLGCYWIYFLDHDANISTELFKLEKELFTRIAKAGQKVGIVSCIVSNGERYLGKKLFGAEYTKVAHVIMSGILTNLHVIRENGPLNEHLFADWVDLEFNIRISRNGYSVYRINRVLIVQDFGETIHGSNLMLKAIIMSRRIYSRILLSLNRRNVYSVDWPFYSPSRWEEILKALSYCRQWGNVHMLVPYIVELLENYLVSGNRAYLTLIEERLKK
jgi:rhamnosyltransferase